MYRMTRSQHVRGLPVLVVLFVAATAAACGLGEAGGSLGRLQKMAGSCPPGKQVAGFAAIDESGMERGDATLSASRLQQVKNLATQTAVCGGQFEVTAFSSSETAFQTLYQGNLQAVGATLNARLLRVPKIVDAVMQTVTEALPGAVRELPAGATDVLSQFTAAAQYVEQLGNGYALDALILSSGIATTGVAITNVPNFTATAAASLAARVPVPRLAGATVEMTGIGVVASGSPAPTYYVQNLTHFYQIACQKTGADCTVVTNPAGEET